jgi:hypothetical protein
MLRVLIAMTFVLQVPACTKANPDFTGYTDGSPTPTDAAGERRKKETGSPDLHCLPRCQNRECGPDGCGGSCGECPGNDTCDTSTGQCVCQPKCGGKECGPNGCGGSCGECPDSHTCALDTGQCIPVGCGVISFQGCCAGQLLKWCENGDLHQKDCTNDPKCGWDYINKYYDCGTDGWTDPSGQYPKKCP